MEYVRTAIAVKILGLHPNTLRKLADDGKINSIRTNGGQRRYDVQSYLRAIGSSKTILYCRVSSKKQNDDLQRQVQRLELLYPNSETIKDIGSGLNFKRKGLQSILDRILKGEKLTIVVTNRDRLARFGQVMLEYIINKNGGKLVVLDQPLASSSEGELAEDLLAILHHFSCKMHGKRSHKHKGVEDSSIPESSTNTNLKSMVGNIKTYLQQNYRVSEFKLEEQAEMEHNSQ